MAVETLAEPELRAAALLHYRPYRGPMRGSLAGVGAIARTGLRMIARRRLFWVLYALAALIFLFFFFGQYIFSWLSGNVAETTVRVGAGAMPIQPERILAAMRDQLKINGAGATYSNFIWYEGYLVMIVLALAGAILVGNDFRYGSLPFYLSKPITRWHYVLGKCLTVAVFVNAMTTLPALALWIEYGLLESWSYFGDTAHLALGIVGYGLVLSVVLSLLLVATATWLRRTTPMIMIWATLFVFARGLGEILVRVTGDDARWRLIDLWSNMYVVGCWAMRSPPIGVYPSPGAAAVPLLIVCLVSVLYLNRRIRAVEVV
jgi:ABC-type transport system involved in multi-copper enzyme maturation permease subunit